MKIHYTGKLEKLDADAQKKLDTRFARLGKLLDRKSEKEAHVILKTERHLRRAEITVNVAGQPQAGIHAATDQLTALAGACDKLEKQLLKVHDKRLAGKRRAGKAPVAEIATPAAVLVDVRPQPRSLRVYRIKPDPKPLTLEEAIMELDGKRSHVAYRDAETGRISVLVRRTDGNFDLIES